MKPSCPHCNSPQIQRRGFFYVRVLKRYRRRFLCRGCGRTFSTQTTSNTYRQKRPDLNEILRRLLTNGMSQRQIARVLECSKNTIDQKVMWLSTNVQERPLKEAPMVLFIDEMESIEHTKLKPLTLPLAVGDDYRIYAMTVGRIQAKGPLAELSRKKYGRRVSEKRLALERLFKSLQFRTAPRIIRTDKSPFYKEFVKKIFPQFHTRDILLERTCEKKEGTAFPESGKEAFRPAFSTQSTMCDASSQHQTPGEKILVHNKAPGPTRNSFKDLSSKPNHPLRLLVGVLTIFKSVMLSARTRRRVGLFGKLSRGWMPPSSVATFASEGLDARLPKKSDSSLPAQPKTISPPKTTHSTGPVFALRTWIVSF
jgi:transposase-like protein